MAAVGLGGRSFRRQVLLFYHELPVTECHRLQMLPQRKRRCHTTVSAKVPLGAPRQPTCTGHAPCLTDTSRNPKHACESDGSKNSCSSPGRPVKAGQ